MNGRRSVAVVTFGNIAPPLVALVTAPILAQALGVEGRGLLSAAIAPLLLTTSGMTLGIPESVTYLVAQKVRHPRWTLGIGLLISLVLGGIGSALIAALSGVLSDGDAHLDSLIAYSGLALAPTMMLGAIRGYARGLQRWMLVASEQLCSAMFRLVSIVLLASTNLLSVENAVIVSVLAGIVGCVAYALLLSRRSAERPIERMNLADVRERASVMLRFGLGIWVGAAAGVLLSKLDLVLILPLSSASELGLYAVAMSIADTVRVFNKAVRDVVFSKQSNKQDDEMLSRASRVSTLLTLFAAIAVAILSYLLIPLLFGDDFKASTELVIILLVGIILGNPGSVLAAGLSARGRPMLRSIAMLIGVVTNIIGIVLLVPVFGAQGAAFASVASNVVTAVMVLVFAAKFFSLNPVHFLSLRRVDFIYLLRSIPFLKR